MAAMKLDKKGLVELIDGIKAGGGNPGKLEDILNDMNEDEKKRRPVPRRGIAMRLAEGEEQTLQEFLEDKVGWLFPSGITQEIVDMCIEMDGKYTLEELRDMCREAELSMGGDKKILAAKLLAHRWHQEQKGQSLEPDGNRGTILGNSN